MGYNNYIECVYIFFSNKTSGWVEFSGCGSGSSNGCDGSGNSGEITIIGDVLGIMPFRTQFLIVFTFCGWTCAIIIFWLGVMRKSPVCTFAMVLRPDFRLLQACERAV